MELLPTQGQLLKAVLDVTYRRHSVLAGNLANVNTPGYRRQDVDYFASLETAIRAPSTASKVSVKVVDAPATLRSDGNTVDADVEIARLTQNALMYQVAAEILSRKLAMARRALSGGA